MDLLMPVAANTGFLGGPAALANMRPILGFRAMPAAPSPRRRRYDYRHKRPATAGLAYGRKTHR